MSRYPCLIIKNNVEVNIDMSHQDDWPVTQVIFGDGCVVVDTYASKDVYVTLDPQDAREFKDVLERANYQLMNTSQREEVRSRLLDMWVPSETKSGDISIRQ